MAMTSSTSILRSLVYYWQRIVKKTLICLHGTGVLVDRSDKHEMNRFALLRSLITQGTDKPWHILFCLKVHSHGAAAATAFLPQWGQSVHTVWQQHRQSNTQCNAKYVALPLPQPHRMGLEPIYLWHCHCSHCRKCSCE